MAKKEVQKEIEVNNNNVHETVTYFFHAACPYCAHDNVIEQEYKPHAHHCDDCGKEFKIRYSH